MPTQSYTPLAIATVSGDSQVTFSNIPNTYTHLQISIQAINSTNHEMWLRFNTDSGATNYRNISYRNVGGITTSVGDGSGAYLGYIDNQTFSTNIDVFDYSSNDVYKFVQTINRSRGDFWSIGSTWKNTNSITTIDLIPFSGSLTGKIALYGLLG